MQLSEAAWVGLSKLARENKEHLVEAYAEKARRSLRNYCLFMDAGYQMANHLDKVVIPELEDVISGKTDRLMLFCPPRHSKSETVSRKFPAYYLGRNPNHEIILTSYSFNLAKGFSRAIRDQINDTRYRALFNLRLKKDQGAVDHWGLHGHKGGLLASGVGGSITGHGADLFIIDDPLKGLKEAESELIRERLWDWYQSVALTRLHPGAKVIVVLTRWHKQDLAGKIVSDLTELKDWKVVNLKAVVETRDDQTKDPLGRRMGEVLWSERYNAEMLGKTKRRVGSKIWNSLYQGEPQDPEETKFKREWFDSNMYDNLPQEIAAFGGIDTASSTKEKADNMAFVTVYRSKFTKTIYVHDSTMGKYTNSQFGNIVLNKDKSVNGEERYVRIRLENNNGGEWVRQRIRELAIERGTPAPRVMAVQTSTDKMVRAMKFQHLVETGVIKWNRANRGVHELITHLINFDGKGSDIDDDVDALGFAIEEATCMDKHAFYSVTPEYDPTDIN